MGELLSGIEIQNTVAYLKSLKARDLSRTIQVDLPGGLTFERLRNAQAEPQNWLTYWGNYEGHHFSPLKQITQANVSKLQAQWSAQIAGSSSLEATPAGRGWDDVYHRPSGADVCPRCPNRPDYLDL